MRQHRESPRSANPFKKPIRPPFHLDPLSTAVGMPMLIVGQPATRLSLGPMMGQFADVFVMKFVPGIDVLAMKFLSGIEVLAM